MYDESIKSLKGILFCLSVKVGMTTICEASMYVLFRL